MNPLRTFCLLAGLMAVALAGPTSSMSSLRRGNSINNSMKPTEWISPAELEALPALNEVTMEQLQRMSPQEGAELVDTLYHLAQINQDELEPSVVPNKRNIPCYILKPNGKNVSTTLDNLPEAADNEPNFGDEEVTIFITGYSQDHRAARKASQKLIQNYMERYNAELEEKIENKLGQKYNNQNQQQNKDKRNKNIQGNNDLFNSNRNQDSDEYNDNSDEDYSENWNQRKVERLATGDLVMIDLAAACGSFNCMTKLDVEKTGQMIGQVLVKLSKKCDVPQEIIHILGQGVAAHVAGASGRECARITGRRIRRITGLDPTKIFIKNSDTITGLARGDADFVDAIHTTPYGLGTPKRVADVDFFPNGPSAVVPGTDSVIEGALRATRYFAESVRPGNEHNFPAVNANSLKQYKSNNGHGKRAYMGIATDFDLEGDFILSVNKKSPFGKSESADRQAYHKDESKDAWKSSQDY